MPLFEVAIIEKPTKKAAEEGAEDKLILPITAYVAANDKAAGLKAIKAATLPDDPSRVEVVIRPFV